jgi:hypothetical protein
MTPPEIASTFSSHVADERGGVTPLEGLYNDTVAIYKWEDLNAFLPSKGDDLGKTLLEHMSGETRAGKSRYTAFASVRGYY